MNTSFFRRWDVWWCGRTSPHGLALFRIAFGLFLLIEACTYVPGIDALFSNHGLIASLWADHLPAQYRFLLQPPDPLVARIIFGVYLLACSMLMTGFAMRTALTTLILLFLYYWQLSFHLFPSSYHRLFFVTLIILLFSGADRTFSFHMLRRQGSIFGWEEIGILPQRLLMLQITATYIGVGFQKMWLPDWQNGRILYYSFLGKWASPPAFALARVLPPVSYDILNWAVRLLEFFLPFCLWIRHWRPYAIIAGTVFHVSIAILLGIWWFLVLPPAYILFFDPKALHRRLHEWSPHHISL